MHLPCLAGQGGQREQLGHSSSRQARGKGGQAKSLLRVLPDNSLLGFV